jgi:hypothetical protein
VVEAIRPQRSEIEDAVGEQLWWKGGRLELRLTGVNFLDRESWGEQHEWMLEKLALLVPVASRLIDSRDLSGEDEDSLESGDDHEPSAVRDEDDDDDDDE